ncbi:hypothetical protein SPRG_22187 [Saprolegnia parasitica CBS 223.65]|uniref:Chromo domain-containing protein n=1 Tax=Saprolegnia parasitica (strain CBS 223.65) TaxID=695850 RepID=A0A067CNI7_SAPPC|nr:hypothetical protein SPRG_22187 [Saprolegnia parasitica CBS 223.65]KDO28382.1 hypothetical protein SPRG_22187 [Saprolegnia parasitica CBS 223.65]|eukprot:XP_012200966.1 hypothetical protein SPRG_22187 [Saprolegnia parasitica CBS 223.65]
MIKMLTGETEPTQGTLWKHPAMRFAYVAQHAFHHIEQHLDISANQYIQWRFQSGEDKELMAKETRKLTPEEKELLAKPVNWEGEKRVFESIENRRKLKKSFEYEVKWMKLPDTENSWIPREKLEKWDKTKIEQIDAEESVDAFGNKVVTKVKRKLTRKELKAKLKAKKDAEKRGEYYSDSDLDGYEE